MQEILNLEPIKMNAGRNLQPGILSVFWFAYFSFPKLLQKKMMKLYWWLRNCLIQESGEQGTLLLDEWVSLAVWVYLGTSVFFFGNVISWFSIWCEGVQVKNWPELGMLFSWKVPLWFSCWSSCAKQSSLCWVTSKQGLPSTVPWTDPWL